MKSRFVESSELSPEFPYRAKALFAFEEVDGTDICFFGMHVQVCCCYICWVLEYFDRYFVLIVILFSGIW